MSKPTEHDIEEFANALQLSIKTKISAVTTEDKNVIIVFDSQPKSDDGNLQNILKLFEGEWKKDKK